MIENFNQQIKDRIITRNVTKRAFKMKYKALFIIFKELLLKQIIPTFLEGGSPTLKKTKWLMLRTYYPQNQPND